MSETTPPTPETAEEKYEAARLVRTDLDGVEILKEDIASYNPSNGGLVKRLMQKDTDMTEETRVAMSIAISAAINQVLQDTTDELMIKFNGIFNSNL